MISYIVSSYARGAPLNACLASLSVQRYLSEAIICANSTDPRILADIESVASRYGHRVDNTGSRGAANCYESANLVYPSAWGDWLCFPSDDSLYVADFSRIMVDTAERTDADLVYCDMVYRLGTEVNAWEAYSVLISEPRMGRIDKTNFIIRRELFKGFPEHPRNWRDGAFIEQAIQSGAKAVKAPGLLVVHQ